MWLQPATVALVMVVSFASGAEPRIEFATSEATGRGIHPVRLFVDGDGPARRSPLRLETPPGTRFLLPPPPTVAEGETAPAVHVFHLLVLPEAAAGVLEMRGSLGLKPLEARLAVHSHPDFAVLGSSPETLLSFGGEGIPATLVVRNRGNTALSFHPFSQTGTDGPGVVIAGDSFELPAGGEREVSLVIRPPERSRVATEHSVAVLVEGRADGFSRTDASTLKVLFVPNNPEPGPLFAVLTGTLDAGLQIEKGSETFASQFRLSGEIKPGVTIEAHALDGVSSVLGSQLELAGRDTWRVALESPGWHATAGEARAPSLGFLAPGIYGRGGVVGARNAGWSADLFALRDHFAGSIREAAGVRVAGPGESWEAGAILQRSRERTFAEEERSGAFAGLHWNWKGVKGHSEVAVAGNSGAGASIGLAQTLGYHDERARIDARIEHAGQGFFLQDQSSELQSVHAEWIATDRWTLLAGADRSKQTGRLRTLLQERDNTGAPSDPAGVIELINEVATRQENYYAGVRREFAPGSFKAAFKRQTRAGELDALREFTEDALEVEWTSRPKDPWWRLGATAGREAGAGNSAKFAEVSGSAYWSPTTWSRLEGNVRWTSALSGEPQGFRREGIHGQVTGSVSPARGWKAEVRVEGYDYADFDPRSRIGALLRFPIGKRGWSGAVEWGRDTRSGDESTWLVVRAPLSFEMPWRPTRGAISGRITDAATGAGLPSVLVKSGRYRAMSDPKGRYQLPAMEPGHHELDIQTPGGWTRSKSVPDTMDITAGRADSLDIALIELGTLRGEVLIVNPTGATRAAPAGVLVAEGADGVLHETLAFRGAFTMRLPPGSYKLSFISELPEAVGRQLVANVTVGEDTATVRLIAREEERGIRKTLTPNGGESGRRR